MAICCGKAKSDQIIFIHFYQCVQRRWFVAAQARACVFQITTSARENCSVLSENARVRTRSKFLQLCQTTFWRFFLIQSSRFYFHFERKKLVKPRCVTFWNEEIWTSLDKIFEKEGCKADANKFWEKGKIFFLLFGLFTPLIFVTLHNVLKDFTI